MKKFPSTSKVLLLAGMFFIGVGAIEILIGVKNTNSTMIGTMYILASIIVQTIVTYSIPVSISNNIKPEVIDLLEWSHKNLPNSNHPDLCADFVEEFRKRFDAAKKAPSQAADII